VTRLNSFEAGADNEVRDTLRNLIKIRAVDGDLETRPEQQLSIRGPLVCAQDRFGPGLSNDHWINRGLTIARDGFEMTSMLCDSTGISDHCEHEVHRPRSWLMSSVQKRGTGRKAHDLGGISRVHRVPTSTAGQLLGRGIHWPSATKLLNNTGGICDMKTGREQCRLGELRTEHMSMVQTVLD
jgi:hypothetical protein